MVRREVMGVMLNGADVVGWHVHEPISFLGQLIEGRLLSCGGSYQWMVTTGAIKKLLEST